MKTLYLDYETYYDDVYSLRKMTPVQYILDQRFECIGAAVAINDGTPYWIDGSDLQAFFNTLDPNDVRVVSHNQLFDACISSWIYNFNPKLLVDTLGMARAMLSPYLRSLSLEKVATHLGIGIKGGTIHQVKGMNAAAIRAAGLWDAYTAYACNDVVLCRAIYGQLKHHFPVAEYVVNDSIIRCAITPQFQIDPNILAEHLAAVKASKETLLQACGLTSRDDLMSNEKFAGALRSIGVEPPMKTSLLTKKETYAFAKTDKDFTDLETHEDPRVQVLVAARLGVKSTIEETRTQRFLDIAALQWPAAWRAKRMLAQQATEQVMPIALKYAGAATGRLSGDWKLNQQNLGRGSPLRSSLVAPPGHSVVAVDASQIEARVVAWLAGQDDLVADFAAGVDVYSKFAGESVYGYEVTKKTHPAERFLGKTAILGLGYSLGATKFEKTVTMQAAAQGIAIEMDPMIAAKVVGAYRTRYSRVPATWAKLQLLLPGIATGDAAGQPFGPCTLEKQAILLPSGQRLFYHNLQSTQEGWKYEYAGKPRYVYGGKLFENCLSADTLVLTPNGWTAIVEVGTLPVWDGIEWVTHDGIAERGVQITAPIDGVRMTADHLVLTTEGWKNAASCQGYHRAEVTLPDRRGARRVQDDGQWAQANVADQMCMWQRSGNALERVLQGNTEVVRMYAGGADQQGSFQTPDEYTSSLCGVALNDGQVPSPQPPRMGSVWGARNTGMSAMGAIRSVLEGHEPDVLRGAYARPARQQSGVFPSELSLGITETAGEEHASQPDDRHPEGAHAAVRSVGAFGYWGDDPLLSARSGLADGEVVRPATVHEQTYDLLNAGPRHRFVVLGEHGPFIVHNCVQALARIVVMDAMLRLRSILNTYGVTLAHTVHDELVYVVPTELVTVVKAIVLEEMRRRPTWAPGLPLDAEAGSGPNYGEAK